MIAPILLKNKTGLKLMPPNCFEVNKLVPNTNPSGMIVNYVQRHSPRYCSKDFFKIKLWFAQFDLFDQRFAFTTLSVLLSKQCSGLLAFYLPFYSLVFK